MSRAHPGFRIQLCEYAAHNPDGTYTVIRGDLVNWTMTTPFAVVLYAFVDCQKDVLPAGVHMFEASVTQPGAAALPWCTLELTVERGKHVRFGFGSPLQFDRYGLWRFEGRCGEFRAETTLDVRSPTEMPSA